MEYKGLLFPLVFAFVALLAVAEENANTTESNAEVTPPIDQEGTQTFLKALLKVSCVFHSKFAIYITNRFSNQSREHHYEPSYHYPKYETHYPK